MKNLLESFAVLLVGVLSVFIIYFIVQYNMIDEKTIEDIDYTVTVSDTDNADSKADDLDDDLDDDEDI